MAPEERAEIQKRMKYYKYLKVKGTPAKCSDEELEQVRRHCQVLKSYGMSASDIAEAAVPPLSTTNVILLVRGDSTRIYRRYYDRLMAVEPQQGKGYARVPMLPTMRRLQALSADGYGYRKMAEWLTTSPRHTWKLTSGETPGGYIFVRTDFDVRRLYEKLAGTDPVDHGMTRQGAAHARNSAAKRGYAPSHCWDTDTIDDPDAVADWTGGPCGTMKGYRIHHREGIPVCPPCADAKRANDKRS